MFANDDEDFTPVTPNFEWLAENPICFVGFGFGSGLSPKAPGTAGTVVGVLLAALLMWIFHFPEWCLIVFGVLLFPLGVWVCNACEKKLHRHDYGGVVFDEIGAIIFILGFVPFNFFYWLAAFALFRFFDAVKPYPVSYFDKNIQGGLGTMLDDYVAALLSIIPLVAVKYGLQFVLGAS